MKNLEAQGSQKRLLSGKQAATPEVVRGKQSARSQGLAQRMQTQSQSLVVLDDLGIQCFSCSAIQASGRPSFGFFRKVLLSD